MFFSRALLVVYKTTGGKAWNPPGGLKPLSATQQRNKKKNIEQALKNQSVLKMAAALQPEEPTRLYKPLCHWRLIWMRKKMDTAKELLGWSKTDAQRQLPRSATATAIASAAQPTVSGGFEARVLALATQLRSQSSGGTAAGQVAR
mmetsp:Transcript_11770/g.20977  ORF Transcript_11770/g.20977 Transcript_11770/m.20977 type:complete len:146 (+) Transcript_11770:173-610(+)|eukprot:CAMPEP_0119108312 /NCGR_PEP_ID=MMETSP1180-20130426/13692_1 /TAXON_ID=3052 ORGANISM="Chlamydomonas cf sp, Strain CCMP681" /NCGR_SAMPLE_ID=MMETSP1180 /ASSEMBLY_ACC=CAM_ASM_000741 /LENGTH=145 /DNA_ID=CAMNT_0007093913 /DNA_START=173 /DNA_END=610 /DNA_ORIENTATION=+